MRNVRRRSPLRTQTGSAWLELQKREIETVDVRVTKIKAETDKALLCVIGGRKYWVPRSQVIDSEKYSTRHWNQDIEMTLWIVKQLRLAAYL